LAQVFRFCSMSMFLRTISAQTSSPQALNDLLDTDLASSATLLQSLLPGYMRLAQGGSGSHNCGTPRIFTFGPALNKMNVAIIFEIISDPRSTVGRRIPTYLLWKIVLLATQR